jgi:hypothetical protein
MIDEKLAARFAATFESTEQGHIVAGPTCHTEATGKVKPDGTAYHRGPIPKERWEQHLRGLARLGAAPNLNVGGPHGAQGTVCGWSAIDDDTGEFEAVDHARGLQEHDIPGLVCRTKTPRHYRIYFFHSGVDSSAKKIVGRLREICIVLGLDPDMTEIVPRQTEATGGEYSSYWFPYFACEPDGRGAECWVRADGSEATLAEFIAVTDQAVMSKSIFPQRQTDTTDEPPPPREFRKKEPKYKHPDGRNSKLHALLSSWFIRFPEKTEEEGKKYATSEINQMDDPPSAEEIREWNVPDMVRRTRLKARDPEECKKRAARTTAIRAAKGLLNLGMDPQVVYAMIAAQSPGYPHYREWYVSDIMAWANEQAQPTATAAAAAPKLWSRADLLPIRERGIEAQKFAVEGVLAERSASIFVAEYGSGKSTLAASIGYAVAHGTRWAGRTVRRHPVLIVDRENTAEFMLSIFDRLKIQDDAEWFGVNLRTDAVQIGPGSPELLEWVRAVDPKPLIIFDSLRAFLEGEDENDSTAVRAFFEPVLTLRDAGATVLLLHHMGKNKIYRGSSDIAAAVDWMWRIESHNTTKIDSFAFEVEKARGLAPKFGVKFNAQTGSFDDVVPRDYQQDMADSRNKALGDILRANPGLSQNDFLKLQDVIKRNISDRVVRAYLAKGKEEGWIEHRRAGNDSGWYYRGTDGPTGAQENLGLGQGLNDDHPF